MTENAKPAQEILEQAMGIEQEGNQFYVKAAQTTQDIKGQEMFSTLADDEQKHYELIKRQYTSLNSKGKWAGSSSIKPADIDLSRTLFPKGLESLEKTITARSNDWDALLFGLDIEIRSYDLYRKAASQIEDSLGKQIFEYLAGQEQSHFDLLMMRYDALFGPISW